jgi:hypothetical protein
MQVLDGPHALAAPREFCPTVRCCFMTGSPTPFTEAIDAINELAGRPPGRRPDR